MAVLKGGTQVQGSLLFGAGTASTWGGGYPAALEAGSNAAIVAGGTSSTGVVSTCCNCYYDGTAWKHKNTASSRDATKFTISNQGINLELSPSAAGGTTASFTSVFFTSFLASNPTSNYAMIRSSFSPADDNVYSLGSSSFRWSTVYAATGSINTSDERLKKFYDIEEAEKKAALEIKAVIKKFKFTDAIEEKGEDNARYHFGVGAQTVVGILQNNGLNPFDYGFVCYDKWDAKEEIRNEDGSIKQHAQEAGDRYGIRYEELTMFILGAL